MSNKKSNATPFSKGIEYHSMVLPFATGSILLRYMTSMELELKRIKKCEAQKRYRQKNLEQVKKSTALWLSKNKEKQKEYQKEYQKKWAAANKDKIVKAQNKYRIKKGLEPIQPRKPKRTREESLLADKIRYMQGKKKKQILTIGQKIKRKEYLRLYRIKKSNEIKEKDKKRLPIKNLQQKQRRINNPIFAIASRVRCRTRSWIRSNGAIKSKSTELMIGCTWDMLKSHIEKQFSKGMKWSNMHQWEIDHIIPLSSAKNVRDFEKLSHFSNLQPLWIIANRIKSNKITKCQPELILTFK